MENLTPEKTNAVAVKNCLSGTSLVGVVHGVRVAQSLAFYESDPMYLLLVPGL